MRAPKYKEDSIEVRNLKAQAGKLEQRFKYAVRASHAILNNIENVMLIKDALKYDDAKTAKELWNEIDEEDQKDLMTAYRKGGAFTARERAMILEVWKE